MSRLLSQDEIDSLGERVAAFIATVETIRSLPFEHADTVADAIEYGGDRTYAFEVAGWLIEDNEFIAGSIREWLLAYRPGFRYGSLARLDRTITDETRLLLEEIEDAVSKKRSSARVSTAP